MLGYIEEENSFLTCDNEIPKHSLTYGGWYGINSYYYFLNMLYSLHFLSDRFLFNFIKLLFGVALDMALNWP